MQVSLGSVGVRAWACGSFMETAAELMYARFQGQLVIDRQAFQEASEVMR